MSSKSGPVLDRFILHPPAMPVPRRFMLRL
jgi:hypothetical protein